MPPHEEITELLIEWNNGDAAALERLMPLVRGELHRIASRHMRREGAGHTLQTTALVNEAYLKLAEQREVRWQNRAHFFALVAHLMRRILIDHARAQTRAKRGGRAARVALSDEAVSATSSALTPARSLELLALDQALSRLAEQDEAKARVVEMRYFGGLSVEETAEVLGVAPVTVMRHWKLAKAWLKRELQHGEGGDTDGVGGEKTAKD